MDDDNLIFEMGQREQDAEEDKYFHERWSFKKRAQLKSNPFPEIRPLTQDEEKMLAQEKIAQQEWLSILHSIDSYQKAGLEVPAKLLDKEATVNRKRILLCERNQENGLHVLERAKIEHNYSVVKKIT